MKRDLTKFTDRVFDICILGGGIYGVCAAWDAASRGLSVALVEKFDFGHATTFNSQNTIHGGFRYLQNLDVKRIREAVIERRTWMTIAPHLVHPMPFLIPIYRSGGKSKWLFSLAFKIYDLLSYDRNKSLQTEKYIPSGRLISPQECRNLIPVINEKEITGGAIFYDGIIYNSERLGLSILKSAANAGAVVANYVEAFDFLLDRNQVEGVRVRDMFTNDELDIKAKMVVNMSGPWINRTLAQLKRSQIEKVELMKVMYLAVKKPVLECAVGLLGDHGKYFFTIPWHNHTLVGIAELPFNDNDLDILTFREEDIEAFISDVNGARPGVNISRDDVVAIRGGILPADKDSVVRNVPQLTTKAKIIDHSKTDGINGLISVVGIKYTMARRVAQQIVDMVFSKIGYTPPKCRTQETCVYGGKIKNFSQFMVQAIDKHRDSVGEESVKHLVRNYGSAYHEILNYVDKSIEIGETLSHNTQVLKAEVIHAIREEMAEKLDDVVFRRTELGILGHPGESALRACAVIMANEKHWDNSKKEKEIQEVNAKFKSGIIAMAPNV